METFFGDNIPTKSSHIDCKKDALETFAARNFAVDFFAIEASFAN